MNRENPPADTKTAPQLPGSEKGIALGLSSEGMLSLDRVRRQRQYLSHLVRLVSGGDLGLAPALAGSARWQLEASELSHFARDRLLPVLLPGEERPMGGLSLRQ